GRPGAGLRHLRRARAQISAGPGQRAPGRRARAEARALRVSKGAPPPVAAVRALLEPYLLEARSPASGVVLAVSGGPDSMALMRIAAEVRAAGALVPVMVATVDHGLRPQSRAEAETVAGWAGACGFPHELLAWSGEKP